MSAPVSTVDDVVKRLLQRFQLLDGHAEAFDDGGRDVDGLASEFSAACREGDLDGPLIRGVSLALDESGGLESFQQRGQRGGLQLQQDAEVLDAQWFGLLPQAEHDEVLGMGQAEWFQQGPVEGDHVTGGQDLGEADLLLQAERVLRGKGPLRHVLHKGT
jgi:hypothetical protein